MQRSFVLTSAEIAAIDSALLDYIHKLKMEQKSLVTEEDIQQSIRFLETAKRAHAEILN